MKTGIVSSLDFVGSKWRRAKTVSENASCSFDGDGRIVCATVSVEKMNKKSQIYFIIGKEKLVGQWKMYD